MRHRLILMRHGKSDWGDNSLSDHDRSLNERGRTNSPQMAEWLKEIGVSPDRVLTSSSKRTCETLELMLPCWANPPEVQIEKTLYLASAEAILRTIAKRSAESCQLLILGHNPGMSHLVSHLTDKFVEMPTAAAAVFELKSSDWNSLTGPGDVTLIDFMRPKALR